MLQKIFTTDRLGTRQAISWRSFCSTLESRTSSLPWTNCTLTRNSSTRYPRNSNSKLPKASGKCFLPKKKRKFWKISPWNRLTYFSTLQERKHNALLSTIGLWTLIYSFGRRGSVARKFFTPIYRFLEKTWTAANFTSDFQTIWSLLEVS